MNRRALSPFQAPDPAARGIPPRQTGPAAVFPHRGKPRRNTFPLCGKPRKTFFHCVETFSAPLPPLPHTESFNEITEILALFNSYPTSSHPIPRISSPRPFSPKKSNGSVLPLFLPPFSGRRGRSRALPCCPCCSFRPCPRREATSTRPRPALLRQGQKPPKKLDSLPLSPIFPPDIWRDSSVGRARDS